jgi:hypothetical protein
MTRKPKATPDKGTVRPPSPVKSDPLRDAAIAVRDSWDRDNENGWSDHEMGVAIESLRKAIG